MRHRRNARPLEATLTMSAENWYVTPVMYDPMAWTLARDRAWATHAMFERSTVVSVGRCATMAATSLSSSIGRHARTSGGAVLMLMRPWTAAPVLAVTSGKAFWNSSDVSSTL